MSNFISKEFRVTLFEYNNVFLLFTQLNCFKYCCLIKIFLFLRNHLFTVLGF